MDLMKRAHNARAPAGPSRRGVRRVYMAVHRYPADLRMVGEVVRRVNEGLVPLLRGQEGFLGLELVDVGRGDVIAIATFETPWVGEPGARKAEAWARERLRSCLRAPLTTSQGEVALHAEATLDVARAWR